ncbi:hypothetical protein B0H34DRAFT_381468 [Crassisporium funariophilum]|nr:hypothetical protein B0H34DRAFT_381468 [Crassisporium funariophilum]
MAIWTSSDVRRPSPKVISTPKLLLDPHSICQIGFEVTRSRLSVGCRKDSRSNQGPRGCQSKTRQLDQGLLPCEAVKRPSPSYHFQDSSQWLIIQFCMGNQHLKISQGPFSEKSLSTLPDIKLLTFLVAYQPPSHRRSDSPTFPQTDHATPLNPLHFREFKRCTRNTSPSAN